MSSPAQNRHIARLIVGAMTIDGSFDTKERQKIANALGQMGMRNLIADVGVAIENDDGSFDIYQECKELMELLGSNAERLAPEVFQIVCDVIASDRYVSVSEATYLSSLARRLQIPIEKAQTIFKDVMRNRRCRLELSGESIDSIINENLKELLSFDGASELVGEIEAGSLDEMFDNNIQQSTVTIEDVERALLALGLKTNASLGDAEDLWKKSINELDLKKMLSLGDSYVASAIDRIKEINQAYSVIARFKKSQK